MLKIINTLSGGKDSQAATLWLLNNGYNKFESVFCDTGWESPITYQHLQYMNENLNLELKTLKSKKYDGLIDLARKKTRFPSTTRRFCTSELKSIPMIDYILDEVQENFLVVQGIRGGESESRSKMQSQCNYFKYYLEPTGFDKKGKPKYHTYRRKEVLAYCKKYATDVLRPIFDWNSQQVIDYIVENGMQPNPLYSMGCSRVGCFPCIMANQQEIYQISQRFPERINEIARQEKEIGSSFFGPDKIPSKYHANQYPLISDVVRYVNNKYDSGQLFDDFQQPTSCMSYYGLCE